MSVWSTTHSCGGEPVIKFYLMLHVDLEPERDKLHYAEQNKSKIF